MRSSQSRRDNTYKYDNDKSDRNDDNDRKLKECVNRNVYRIGTHESARSFTT